jgi:hypothetical protein
VSLAYPDLVINKSEEALIRDIERRLIDMYPQLPATQVVAAIAQARDRFAGSPVREFVTVFVERQARRELSRCVETPLARAG